MVYRKLGYFPRLSFQIEFFAAKSHYRSLFTSSVCQRIMMYFGSRHTAFISLVWQVFHCKEISLTYLIVNYRVKHCFESLHKICCILSPNLILHYPKLPKVNRCWNSLQAVTLGHNIGPKKTSKIHRYRSNNWLRKNWLIYVNWIDYIIDSLSKYRNWIALNRWIISFLDHKNIKND